MSAGIWPIDPPLSGLDSPLQTVEAAEEVSEVSIEPGERRPATHNRPGTVRDNFGGGSTPQREDPPETGGRAAAIRNALQSEVTEEPEIRGLTLHEFNGVQIGQQSEDGYVNATVMCQVAGKRFNNWFRMNQTQELIERLSVETRISAMLLVRTVRGAPSLRQQGSWIRPDLAMSLAYWCSPALALFCNRLVREWADREVRSLAFHEHGLEMRARARSPGTCGVVSSFHRRELREFPTCPGFDSDHAR